MKGFELFLIRIVLYLKGSICLPRGKHNTIIHPESTSVKQNLCFINFFLVLWHLCHFLLDKTPHSVILVYNICTSISAYAHSVFPQITAQIGNFTVSSVSRIPDYTLTTAQIFYRFPDFPALLQEFIIQKYDIAPKYPEFSTFLRFWENEVEAEIHSIVFSSANLVGRQEASFYRGQIIHLQ